MGRRGGLPMFEFAFRCLCGVVIEQKLREAIVASETGGRATCQACNQWYRVTKKGADPIEPSTGRTLEEIGRTASNAIQRHDAGREIPALRFAPTGGQGQSGSPRKTVWALRMPSLRNDQTGMGKPTDSTRPTREKGRQPDE